VKARREARGIHLYDRVFGIHVLLDEFPQSVSDIHRGPAVLSIALTNACDLRCPFCYAPKSAHVLNPSDVTRWAKEFSISGTIEIAFGGGEPTLYPQLATVCQEIWKETDMGISITTHGQHLQEELVRDLVGFVSILRLSIDGPEPYYSTIRRRPLRRTLENIQKIEGRIPIGINTVVNRASLQHLDELKQIVLSLRAVDWLLLPEVRDGYSVMGADEWRQLESWIEVNRSDVNLMTSVQAIEHLATPTLFPCQGNEYAHIRADGRMCRNSYSDQGVPIGEGSALLAYEHAFENSGINQFCH
jgi:MoaA/NifB/PqqE/SkfB family radical SAM enzyme